MHESGLRRVMAALALLTTATIPVVGFSQTMDCSNPRSPVEKALCRQMKIGSGNPSAPAAATPAAQPTQLQPSQATARQSPVPAQYGATTAPSVAVAGVTLVFKQTTNPSSEFVRTTSATHLDDWLADPARYTDTVLKGNQGGDAIFSEMWNGVYAALNSADFRAQYGSCVQQTAELVRQGAAKNREKDLQTNAVPFAQALCGWRFARAILYKAQIPNINKNDQNRASSQVVGYEEIWTGQMFRVNVILRNGLLDERTKEELRGDLQMQQPEWWLKRVQEPLVQAYRMSSGRGDINMVLVNRQRAYSQIAADVEDRIKTGDVKP